jgi:hypothetical protein
MRPARSSLSVQPHPGAYASQAHAVASFLEAVDLEATARWLVVHDSSCTFAEADDDACSCRPSLVRRSEGVH